MNPEILLILKVERALENQRQFYMPQRDRSENSRRLPQSHKHKENRSIMNLLPNRLLKLVLAFIALATIAMLVGFSVAEPAAAPQSLSGEKLFYSVLGVFDLAVMVGLYRLARL